MPRDEISKYYAVLHGRGGPRVYTTFEEYRAATSHFSGSSGKSFFTLHDAESWLARARESFRDRLRACVALALSQPSIKQEHLPRTMSRAVSTIRTYREAGVQCPNTPPRVSTSSPPGWRDAYAHGSFPSTASTSSQSDWPDDYTDASLWETLSSLSGLSPNDPVDGPPAPVPPRIQLSDEQMRVLEMVKSGQNVFFTGPAGTGKSVLLREIIRELSSRHSPESVAITATTGIAGLNIGGTTLHSFAGIGLGKEPKEKLADRISYSMKLRERWRTTRTLIIDEISMLDGELFDKLEFIARRVRPCSKPFGGIQLVLSGDFFQLPPVPDKSFEYRSVARYAFEAESWERCIPRPVFLSRVFRQTDNEFIDLLAAVRCGDLSSAHIEKLVSLSRPLVYEDGTEPSQLFPLRRDADGCNNNRLNILPGPAHTYKAVDRAGYDVKMQPIPRASAQALLDRLVAPSSIMLKVDAQVMLVQNVDSGLVNGSLGRVVDFMTIHQAMEHHIAIVTGKPPTKEWDDDTRPRRPRKPPPPLMSLSSNSFNGKEVWPLVSFEKGRKLLCAPAEFSVENVRGFTEAHRLQVPLILAWALSIHKSQGQTLTKLKVDLGHAFEKGQVYVALSRATSMESLEVLNFHPSKVLAHPKVLAWQASWTPFSEEDSEFSEVDADKTLKFWELDI